MSSSFVFCFKHFIQNLLVSPFPILTSPNRVLLITVNFISCYLSYRRPKRTVKITNGLFTSLRWKCALWIHTESLYHVTQSVALSLSVGI